MNKKLTITEKGQAKKIGEVLLDTLRINRMNQKDLATKTGIPQTTISSYVRGISIPSFENLGKICVALDVSMDMFNFSMESNNQSRKSVTNFLDALTYKQFRAWVELSCFKVTDIYQNGEDYDNESPISLALTYNGEYFILDKKIISQSEARLLLDEVEAFATKKFLSYSKKYATQQGLEKDIQTEEE